MENNFNQQPQYQQPQYQQPMYQPRPKGPGLNCLVDFFVKLAPVVILVFLCLAGVGFLYEFIGGMANIVSLNNIAWFFYAFENAIAVAAKYIFYSVIVAFLAKILKK